MLQPLWLDPYVVKKALPKGEYELQDWEGVPLAKFRNGLYLKNIMPSSALGMCFVILCIYKFFLFLLWLDFFVIFWVFVSYISLVA